MSKWFGKLGFVETQETEPSVYSEVVTERDCYGTRAGYSPVTR